MSPITRISLAAAVFGISIMVPMLVAQTQPEPLHIRVSDIGKTVTLIGQLGKPLGQKLTVRGRWSIPVSKEKGTVLKDNSPRFTVTEVDGVRFEGKVEFNIGQIRPATYRRKNPLPDFEDWASLDNQVWTMTVYETGSVQIRPMERGEDADFPIVGNPYYFRPFTSELVVVVTSQEQATEGKPK